MKPYRKRKGDGPRRREEILSAAGELFVTQGYENTTIRRIAARAGITSAALYIYFPDKDSILLEICDQAFSRLIERFNRIRLEDGDPLIVLRRMMEAYVRFGLEHPDQYRLTFGTKSEVLPYPHHADIVNHEAPGAKGPQSFAMVQSQVAILMETGVLKSGNPVTTAELIWAAGHGLVSLLTTFPDFPWSDREVLISGIVDLPLRGLLAFPPDERP